MSQFLDSVSSPADIKKLNYSQLEQLCAEIRELLIEVISKNGGHLASNLGVVELTVALHRCFECPKDAIVFDVGHQCYTHKLLTGRKDRFDTLRTKDGVAGFPKPCESECDPFYVGHSSTSISSAIGLARAKLMSGDKSKVIAVIGDGAFASGMVYEAINNIDDSLKNLVVVLNDNEMSISKSVGSLATYLLRLRTSADYNTFKQKVQGVLEKTPIVGPVVMDTLLKSKSALRRAMYKSTLFEELGFNYIGPIDGHNVEEMCKIFSNVRSMQLPVLVHVVTTKGKGYPFAEENPGAYHGVGRFNLEEGNPDISLADSYSNTFGRKLTELAQTDEKICGITAAMKYGTGMQYFYKSHKDRFFDVGIAEEHAMTFSAGLAKGGMKPVFSVYSTFLQRAFDQMFQDVSLEGLDVLVAVDRAGLVGNDGETHQGLLDVSMLNCLDGFTIASPASYDELDYWLEKLLETPGPKAIRYPRGSESKFLKKYGCTKEKFDYIKRASKSGLLLITYGREYEQVFRAAEMLSQKGRRSDILKLNVIKPIDEQAYDIIRRYKSVVFIEESVRKGGIAQNVMYELNERGFAGRYHIIAAESSIVPAASVAAQMKSLGLDCDSITEYILKEKL